MENTEAFAAPSAPPRLCSRRLLQWAVWMGALLLVGCAQAAPTPEATLPAVTLMPAPALEAQGTPSALLPTPDADATPLPRAAPLGLVERWQFSAEGTLWDTHLSDLTAGGYPDILMASDDKTLYALDAESAAYWTFTAAAPLVAVTSADLDGEGPREIVVGGDDTFVRALSPEGDVLWEVEAGARVNALAAGDLDGDGIDEVLAGLWGGTVTALDADGAALWRVETVDGGDPATLTVSDLEDGGDGKPEILLGTAHGALEALDANGTRLWAVEVGTRANAMLVADLDGGGRPEILVATQDGDLMAFGTDGELRWSLSPGGRLTILLAANVDGDPGLEVVAGSGPAPGTLLMADAEGLVQWSATLPGGVRSLAAGDIDEDDGTEIIAGTDDGAITLLDHFGQTRGSFPTRAPVTGLRVATFTNGAAPDVLAQSGETLYLLQAVPSSEAGDPPAPAPNSLAASPDDIFHPSGREAVDLVFAGDVNLSSGVVQSAEAYGSLYPFEGTLDLLRRADVSVVNLDGVLAMNGEPADKPALYRASPTLADGLQLAGVDVALLANDHALDYGQTALDETVAVLGEHNVLTAGVGENREAALTPTIVEVKGLRIAFLAFADNLPRDWEARAASPGVAAANTARIGTAVRAASQQADVVVAGFHMGQAGVSTFDVRQQSLARTAINNGATLVVGYGPGLVQDAVIFRDGFIAYSLGNFVADGPAREGAGALLRVVVDSDGLRTVDVVQTHATLEGQARLVSSDDLPVIERLYPPDVVFEAPRFNANPGSTPDYSLDVALDYDAKRLDVSQRVTARNDSADTWTEFVFNAPPNYIEDVFELNGASVTHTSSLREIEVELEKNETVLRVPLVEPVGPGQFASVALDYTLFPPELFPTDWQPASTLGFDDRLMQVGDWYPALVPYVEGEGWTTWQYTPVGDPAVYPAADYDLSVRAAPGVTVASGGEVARPGSDSDAWRFQLDNARAVSFLASPSYRCTGREVEGASVRSCYQPEHNLAGQAALDITERAVVLFSELFGPYPHDDLVVAENGYYGAMEFSATLSITEPAYAFFNGFPDTLLEALVAHEVAHQWWYDVVGNDQVREPWLDEALATYSELLYYEHYYPELTAWWWNYRVLQYEPSGPVDVNIYDHTQTEPFVRNMYGQAAFFMQDLRRIMGDEAFFTFLRDYYQSGKGQIVTADDFFAIARRHTNDDLTGLLEGYFRNPDH